jgi:hypothetical protein
VNRVDIRTAIEQERDDRGRAADDRAMQRMSTGAIDVAHERRVGIEVGADARPLARLGGPMNGMIRWRR